MKTISFCTLGCRVNQYETRALTEMFVNNGYTVLPFGEKCDVCIVNTCAVTEESERKSAQMIRRAQKLSSDVRVCGCYTQRCGEFPGVSRLKGCFDKGALQDFAAVDKTDRGFELLSIGNAPLSQLNGFSKARAFVKIQDGCNGKCTYCIIPKLRGGIRSRPYEDIVAEVQRLAALGYKEIVLTGIETAAYNYMPLWKLIESVAKIEGVERIRLGSLDPNILNDDFINTAKTTKKLMPHFHLSLQSGCTAVLKAMKRPYTAEKAKERIKLLQKEIPNIMLSADIICSFPGETEDNYNETLGYLKELGFLHVHAFSYSKRPGTEASEMPCQIPEQEKRRRITDFITECDAMKQNQLNKQLGQNALVLVEKLEGGEAAGHTENFCEAIVKTNRPVAVGDIIECHVSEARDGKLYCIQL